jgi:hypothetical protein
VRILASTIVKEPCLTASLNQPKLGHYLFVQISDRSWP